MRYWITWFLIASAFLLFRLEKWPGVFSPEGVTLNGTDPYYRLHRIERIVAEDITYPLTDPDLFNFEVPWPTGLDHAVALPLRLLHVTDPDAIAAVGALVVPLLSLLTLFFLGKSAVLIGGSFFALVVGGSLALFAPHIYYSSLGALDHHFLEALFTALALFLVIRFRTSKRRRYSWIWMALLGWGPVFWPQAWILALPFSLAVLLDRESGAWKKAAPVFFGALLISLLPLSFSDRFGEGTLSFVGLSWWPSLLYLCLAAFFQGVFLFRNHHWRAHSPLSLGILLGGLSLGVFLFSKHGGMSPSDTASSAVSLVTAPKGLLSLTSEALSPFKLTPHNWIHLGYVPLVLAWIWFLFQAFRRERWWLAGFVFIPLVLAIFQVRFMALASSLVLLCSVLLLSDLAQRVVKRKRFQPWILVFLMVLVLVPSFSWPDFSKKGNAHAFFAPVRDASRFLRMEKTTSGKNDTERKGIAGHWGFGHWILFYGDQPVLAHPFHSTASAETLQLFVTDGLSAFAAFQQRYPIRYLLLEAPSPRMFRWLKTFGKPLEKYVRVRGNASGERVLETTAAFDKLFLSQFFYTHGLDEEGNHPKHWRLTYVSPHPAPRSPTGPALKLFEYVAGARIVIPNVSRNIRIRAHIQIQGNAFTYQQWATMEKNKTASWIVPYGETDRGGVSFNGQYWLETERLEHPLSVRITEKDVKEGRKVTLAGLP